MTTLLHSQAAVSAWQFTAFRVIFGCYLAWHYFALVPWATELFSAQGILGAAGTNPFHGKWWNPLFYPEFSPFAPLVPALAGVLAMVFAVGRWRRPVAAVLAVLHSTLFTACPLIANPGLPYVGLVLWLCAIIPAGEHWRAPHAGWKMPGGALFTAGFLLAAGFTFSGVSKMTAPGWIDGSALQAVLSSPLARDNLFTFALLAQPEVILRLLTWATLAFEVLYLPLWLVPRLRAALWISAMAFHLGILLTLDFADLTLGMVMIQLFVMPPPKALRSFWRGCASRSARDSVVGIADSTTALS